MRKLQQLRHNSETKRTHRRFALIVALLGVVATSVSFGAIASARVTAKAPSTATPSPYSGGRLMAADPLGGYWTTTWIGTVTPHDGAPSFGSPALSGIKLSKPIIGMAATPDGLGYWLVASDGGIFTYGDASFYGSTGAMHLNQPIIGMAATPDGLGYWLLASDGGIFTYGDATFAGSLGGDNTAATGIVVNPALTGYSLVETNGTAVTFPTTGVTPAPAGGSTGVTTVAPPVITPVPSAPTASELALNCAPASTTPATTDPTLTNQFSNEVGPGWIAGDATYSTALPDGREAFVFSDTLIGTAQPSGSASVTGFTHNSELVGSMPNLTGNYGGTESAPQTLIPDTTDPGDQWQVSSTDVENGEQLVFVNEFSPVEGSAYAHFTGRSGIAVFSLPSGRLPILQSIALLPVDYNSQWGNAILQSGDYTYIYGNHGNNGSFQGMDVARVPVGQSLDISAWQFWNGLAWVAGEPNAYPMSTFNQLTGVTTQQDDGGYVAVSTPANVQTDNTVDLSYSCSPEGPWTSPQSVYSIPQIRQYPNEIAYFPTFHPELSGQSGLVISYNVDSTSGLSVLEQNVHQYQPQFLVLPSS
jgi:hypothetical protein